MGLLKEYRNQIYFLGITSAFLSTFCFYLYAKYEAKVFGETSSSSSSKLNLTKINETAFTSTNQEIDAYEYSMNQSLYNLEHGFVSNDSHFQNKMNADAKEVQLRQENFAFLKDTKYLSFIQINYFQQIGNWSSTELFEVGNEQYKQTFTKKEGKVSLKVKPTITKNQHSVSLLIYDGEYVEDMIVSLTTKEAIYLPENNTLLFSSTKFSMVLSQAFSPMIISDCMYNGSLEIRNMQSYSKRSTRIQLSSAENCTNFDFEAELTTDLRNETWEIRSYATLITLVAFLNIFGSYQIAFSIEEDELNSSKYSLTSVFLTMGMSFVICMTNFLLALSSDDLLPLFMPPAVLGFLNISYNELKIALLVWKAYETERNPNQNIEVFRRRIFSFCTVYFLMLIMFIIVFFYFLFYEGFFLLLCASMLPQIIHNFKKGTNEGYSSFLAYVVLPKFSILFYFRCYKNNFFEFETSYLPGLEMATILGVQIYLLYLQKNFGSGSILPSFMRNDYKYLMSHRDLEQSCPDFQTEDCSICMSLLLQDSLPSGSERSSNAQIKSYLQKKKHVMRTPCNHKFHIPCLINWMEIKLECPTCRGKLPPLSQP